MTASASISISIGLIACPRPASARAGSGEARTRPFEACQLHVSFMSASCQLHVSFMSAIAAPGGGGSFCLVWEARVEELALGLPETVRAAGVSARRAEDEEGEGDC
jgi:hypothetical protein